ncbi:MAG: Molybdate/tungstate transport system permease protein WtpB [Methanonatronarchaeales archaeon]|nr:Molybdate/tungstate transport system permease protein WtpB [Methanonatronarchaeales archaeon]
MNGGLRGRGLHVIMGGVLLAYLAYPIVTFTLSAGWGGTADIASPANLEAIRHSLVTAPIATAIATALGVPLAYLLARTSFRGKLLVETLVILPLVLPPVVGGTMLLTGFGHFTPVGALAREAGLELTDSLLGVVLAQTFVASPFVVITSRAGFASIDPEIEQASRNLGKGPMETFYRVSLPLARGSILAGVVLTFARSIGEFGATMMTAYNPHTMPTQIWVTFISHGVEATAPLVFLLLGLGSAVVAAVLYVGRFPGVST